MFEYTIEQRAEILGTYIAETHDTVRGAAQMYDVSKSTVHKDVTERLKYVNLSLYKEVKEILEEHKNERHIRGGLATKKKYEKLNKKSKTHG